MTRGETHARFVSYHTRCWHLEFRMCGPFGTSQFPTHASGDVRN